MSPKRRNLETVPVFNPQTQGWDLVDGANFRFPSGPGKRKAEPNHPVTQVSWNDARRLCEMERQTPSNTMGMGTCCKKWREYIRNSIPGVMIWWYSENIKRIRGRGVFRTTTRKRMAMSTLLLSEYFGANKIGLTDMGGNVWQWTEDSIEPTGRDKEFDPATRRVLRGGSFLCDPQVCHGFRVDGRSSSTPESSLMHAGFRCAKTSINPRLTQGF